MQTPIDHFSAITLGVIKDLSAKGILQLIKPGPNHEPLQLDSDECKQLVTDLTTALYEGTVKEVNQHRAPDLT